ncbi:Cupredoxin [Zopfia rhizophila CBS 207.26]|uniref:Cupredoxin n=1 Tax=Zopfia rhizophila CBS 207.26 TaxID=1314779 RepID=A0A6A6E9L8_9PEZI|nr:Cupredoxin [Zopfia rhizophila CBS 207.26]
MHFSTVFAASALMGSALAADHSVKVGGNNGELKFEPAVINATEGDTVTFKFWPKNHSVAQAAFANPCEPMDNGFWSGYIPSSLNAAEESFMIEVTNTSKPIWFYCTQGKHCQQGMVGVINGQANGTGNTLQRFISAASSKQNNVAPSSTAGTGGMIMGANESMTPSSSASGAGASNTGAASTLEISRGVVFSGLLGMFGYLLV